MAKRVPRHPRNTRLLASQSETRTQIDKRFPGLVIVENELALFAQRPSFEHLSSVPIHRHNPNLACLWRKDIQNALLPIYVGPTKDKNLPNSQARIQSKSDDVLEIRSCVSDKTFFLGQGQ